MPSLKAKKALQKTLENGGNMTKAMKEVGYAPATYNNPSNLRKTKIFKEFADQLNADLPDHLLTERHRGLLNSFRLDHMVFPLGPKEEEEVDEDIDEEEGKLPEEYKERTDMTDIEITELLAGVNCVVRKIVHGVTARHVYFWSPDNKARKDAIDLGYKVKGKYPKEGPSTAIQINVDRTRGKYEYSE